MTRGLAIGKFYPPHLGHRHLIETVAAQVDEMFVLVCDGAGQTIPAALRAQWLKEMVPPAVVRVIPDSVPEEDSRGWAEHTRTFLGFRPDVVGTSEDYGGAYARHLGARHLLVDKARARFPISGTAVRRDPLGAWAFLAPCVREYYALRVSIVGAESTGKTTLAQALAARFQTAWVPEYGRDYCERKGKFSPGARWEAGEFLHIAGEQNKAENAAARACNGILICDTDAFCTALWHERYMGSPSPELLALSAGRRPALTLLCDVDIPFVQDGTRDGEKIRPWMHRRFLEETEARGRTRRILSGPRGKRLSEAVEAIEKTRRTEHACH